MPFGEAGLIFHYTSGDSRNLKSKNQSIHTDHACFANCFIIFSTPTCFFSVFFQVNLRRSYYSHIPFSYSLRINLSRLVVFHTLLPRNTFTVVFHTRTKCVNAYTQVFSVSSASKALPVCQIFFPSDLFIWVLVLLSWVPICVVFGSGS